MDSRAVGLRPDRRSEVLMSGVDPMIQSQRPGLLQFRRGPRRAEDGAAHRMGDLDGRRPDATAHGVDQDAFARREMALGQQGIVRGDERLGDGRRLDEIQVRRDRHGQPLVGQDELGLPAPADDPEDPVARLQRARNGRTQRIDLARILQTGDVRRRARRCGIHSPALHEIGPVQPACPNADTDLLAPRLGRGDFANLENLRTAGAGDDDGLHGFVFSLVSSRLRQIDRCV